MPKVIGTVTGTRKVKMARPGTPARKPVGTAPGVTKVRRSPEKGKTFNHCARCKVVPYCSKACQVHHWKNGHKKACQDAQEREEEEFVAEKLAAGTSKAQRPSNEMPQEPRNSSGRGAAAEEEEQKSKPPRQGGPRLDADDWQRPACTVAATHPALLFVPSPCLRFHCLPLA